MDTRVDYAPRAVVLSAAMVRMRADALVTSDKIESLQAELIELNNQAQTIQALADRETRALSEDEEKEIDKINARFEATEADIARRRTILNQQEALRASTGRRTDPDGSQDDDARPVSSPARVQNQGPAPRRQSVSVEPVYAEKGKWGWRNMGEFALSVRHASARGVPPQNIDPRLTIKAAATTYGSEGVDSDGGFAVPPDFRTAIMSMIMGEESLLPRTDQWETSSNRLVLPADESTPWQSSGGIQVYIVGENSQITQSKPQIQERTVPLHKLAALVPMTEELLADSAAMGTFLMRKVPESVNFKVTNLIVNGTGAGQPLGILPSSALVSVAKETGQLAATIQSENILNMYARLYAPSFANAVWLINQDIIPQLLGMTMGLNNLPVYLPPNGLSASPYSTLLGRPVIPTQACKTLGTVGDIILADLRAWQSVVKVGNSGMRADVSMHLWFDYDVSAFRFIFRFGGQPWWSAAMSPLNGSNTLSPFVALATRA